jgi:hypothetical protein
VQCTSLLLPRNPSHSSPTYHSSSDLHDLAMPVVPHLTHSSPYTKPLFIFAVVSLVALIPILHIIPVRMILLILGIMPFLLAHPKIHPVVVHLLHVFPTQRLQRIIDDDNLTDACWRGEIKEVELWENERWAGGKVMPWSKAALKGKERSAWTRGRDGWNGVAGDEVRFARVLFLWTPFRH